jgi:hypothetical protein
VIIGLFIAAFSKGRWMFGGTDMQVILATAEDVARTQPLAYLLIFSGVMLVPSLLMLWVIWAWHLYFQQTGLVIFHWVMTSIALMGLSMMLMSYGTALVGIAIYIQGLNEGFLTKSDGYPVLAMIFSLEFMGVALTYWLYPLMIGFTLLRQGKLSYLFMIALAVFFLVFNAFSIALSPFILGVLMLLQAQRLASVSRLQATDKTTLAAS